MLSFPEFITTAKHQPIYPFVSFCVCCFTGTVYAPYIIRDNVIKAINSLSPG